MLKKDYATEYQDILERDTYNADKVAWTRSFSTHCENLAIWFFDFCSYDNTQYRITFFIQWCIVTFQWMSFLSQAYLEYDWEARVSKVAMSICHFVTEFRWPGFTNYWISVSILVFFFGYSIFTASAMHFRRWAIPVVLMRQLLMWIPSVFFAPLMLPHLRMFFGCFSVSHDSYADHPFYPSLVCWSSGHIGYSVLSFFIGGLFAVYTYVTICCFYENTIPAKNQVNENAINSRSTNRPEMWLFLSRMVLFILYFAGQVNSWRFAMAIILFLTGVATSYHQVLTLPWWEDEAQLLYLFQSMIIAWTGFICFFMTLFNDAEGTGMLFFAFLPVLLFASSMLLRWRYNTVILLAEHELTSSGLCELKVRCLIRAYFKYLRSFGDIYIEDTDIIRQRKSDLVDLIIEYMEAGARRFPEDADLHVFFALFYTVVMNNRVLCYRELSSAKRRHPQFDSRFRIYLITQMLEIATKAQQSHEVTAFIEFKERREYVNNVLCEAMRELVQFWTELLSSAPDIDTLSTLGYSARTKLDITIANYDRLLQLNPKSIQILRAYGLLMLEVTGELKKASELMELADQIEADKKKLSLECNYGEFLNRVNANLDIFDEDNGIISISVDRGTLGVVEQANASLCQMLGYTPTGLIGKSVNSIIPEPIASCHDAMILRYLATKKSTVINNVRLILALHSHGYLVPCVMNVRFSDEQAMKMIAVLHPFISPFEVCALIDAKSQIVLHATQNLHSIFGFSRRDILANVITLKDMVPCLNSSDRDIVDQAHQAMYAKSGYRTEASHAVTDQRFHAHAFLRNIVLEDVSFIFARFVTSQIQNEHTLESDDEFELEASPLPNQMRQPDFMLTPATPIIQGPNPVNDSSEILIQIPEDTQANTADQSNVPVSTTIPLQGLHGMYLHPSSLSRTSSRVNVTDRVLNVAEADVATTEKTMNKPFGYNRIGSLHSVQSMQETSLFSSTVRATRPNPSGTSLDDTAMTLKARDRFHEPFSRQPQAMTLSRQGTIADDDAAFMTPIAGLYCESAGEDVQLLSLDTRSMDGNPEKKLSPDHSILHIPETIASSPRTTVSGRPFPPEKVSEVATLPVPQGSPIASSDHGKISQHSSQSVFPAVASPTNNKSEKKASQLASAASTTSSVRSKRANRGHRRLLKAIYNDNAVTVRKLQWMQIFSVGMIVAILALNIGVYLVTNVYMDEVTKIVYNVDQSSARAVYMMDSLYAYMSYVYMVSYEHLSPNINQLFYIPYEHAAQDNESIKAALIRRTELHLDKISQLSYHVDNAPSRHPGLIELRGENTVDIRKIQGKDIQHLKMPLRSAWAYYGAMIRLSISSNIDNKETSDIGYFFALVNGATSIRDGGVLNTQYLIEEISMVTSELMKVTVVFFVLSIAIVLFVSWAFVRPIVVRIEDSKTEVLNVFKSIPHSIRKILRRKAYNVYGTVRKDTGTDKSMRDLREEDETQAESFNGTASQGGTEFTSHTKYSSFTHASGTNSYADMFQRYQRMKQTSSNFPSVSGSQKMQTSVSTSAQNSAYGPSLQRMGPNERAHVQSHSARSNVIHQVLEQSHQAASARTSMHSARMESKIAPITEDVIMSGTSASPARRLIDSQSNEVGDSSLPADKPTDVFSDVNKALMEGVIEDEKHVGKEKSKNILSRRALQVIAVKFLIFLVIITIYFALCLWETNMSSDMIEQNTETLFYADRRYTTLVMAMMMARQNLFFDYQEAYDLNPLNPVVNIGDFQQVGVEYLLMLRQFHHAVLYGNYFGLEKNIVDDQSRLFYTDACTQIEELGPKINLSEEMLQVMSHCDTFMNGVLTKGVYTGLLQASESVQSLLRNERKKVLQHMLYGQTLPATLSQQVVDSVYKVFRDTDALISSYLFNFLRMSGKFYYDYVISLLDSFAATRLIFMISFSVILLIAYFILFEGNARYLATAALHCKSMMLLTPAGILEHVEAANTYIQTHISSE